MPESATRQGQPTSPIGGILRASAWTTGAAPAFDVAGGEGATRWFELDHEADIGALADALVPTCPGLSKPIIEWIFEPGKHPHRRAWPDSRVQSLLSFGVVVTRQASEPIQAPDSTCSRISIFEPIHLAVGSGWLLSCWHGTRAFFGAKEQPPTDLKRSHEQLFSQVARRWIDAGLTSAADLGVLILHELAESYRPAVYDLYAWLDEWELALYRSQRVNRDTLIDISGAAAVLRDWVKPLNLHGVRADLDRSWFSGTTNTELVHALDGHLDSTLNELRKLSDTLRASFGVAQFQLAEEERRGRERFQRWIAVVTAAFAGPTIVTALFGARATPFGDTWRSFGAITAITLVSIVAIWALIVLLAQRRMAP